MGGLRPGARPMARHLGTTAPTETRLSKTLADRHAVTRLRAHPTVEAPDSFWAGRPSLRRKVGGGLVNFWGSLDLQVRPMVADGLPDPAHRPSGRDRQSLGSPGAGRQAAAKTQTSNR